jgi:drug/metabolite transporter (DMT)-like permease
LLYGILLSLLTCCCWGSTSVCMRGLTKIDSYDMSVLRAVGCFIASLALAVFFSSFSSLGAVPLKVLFVFIPMVLFNNIIGDVFLFLSLHTLGVARGSAISSTYPVVVAIASAIFFGEKLTLPVVAGTLLVVVGVMCLCQKDGPKIPVSVKGLTYAILASLFWGLGIMCTKDLVANGLTPDEVTFGRSVLFMIFALILWLIKYVKLDTSGKKTCMAAILSRRSWLGVLAGFLSLGCGTWFYSSAIEYIPISVATPICAANPLLATIAAYFIFDEKLRLVQWLGVVLAIAGSITVAL